MLLLLFVVIVFENLQNVRQKQYQGNSTIRVTTHSKFNSKVMKIPCQITKVKPKTMSYKFLRSDSGTTFNVTKHTTAFRFKQNKETEYKETRTR